MSVSPSRERGASLRWLRLPALAVYAVVVLEVGAYLTLCFLTRSWLGVGDLPPADFSGEIPVLQDLQRAGEQASERAKDRILHPYLGFIRDRERMLSNARGSFLNFGFGGDAPSVQKRSGDTLIIGVTGGSLASNFVRNGVGSEGLAEVLAQAPGFAGRRVELLPLAWGEYHQPQQLLALSYLLTLGAEFDVIVNLDGFNEILVPAHYNVPQGVAGSYPMRWNLRLQEYLLEPGLHAQVGELYYLAETRRAAARALRDSALRHSFTAQLAWLVRDRARERAIARRTAALATHRTDASRYIFSGPWRRYTSEAELLGEAVEGWVQASRGMRALCEEHGIRYLHLLQPNQYVPGAKPMDAAEQRVALAPESPFARWVVSGYPLLRAAGVRLREAGVAYHDLTSLFGEVRAPVYRDRCCHLNERGERLLGRRLGELLVAEYRPRSGRATRGARGRP